MPSLHSLVVRRASPMDMGTGTSSVTSANPSSNKNNHTQSINAQKKSDKNKIMGVKIPLVRKESSAVNLSLMEKTSRKAAETLLLRPESSASLEPRGGSWISLGPGALRKCETAMGLSSLALEGLRPINRSRVCSRCSSLLSLASSSRYSLAAGNFVPASLTAAASQQTVGRLFCKLCLNEVPLNKTFTIEDCGCSYCKEVIFISLF